MTPYWHDAFLTVYQGDCREVMAQMEPESVHCVVTSPPYWGLRDYGTATWLGGDEGCDHLRPIAGKNASSGLNQPRNPDGTIAGQSNASGTQQYAKTCGKCGAVRQDSQLGLEPTPELYVENMVAVFREVKRVLRRDGTVWMNIGDSYASSAVGVQPVRDAGDDARPGEGDVQAVLPPSGADALDGGALGAVAGNGPSMASRARRGAERSDVDAPAGASDEGDDDAGREVRVLRGDGADLPDAGSRSKRRLQGPEAGTPSVDGAGRAGGLSEGSVPSALLELQRREGAGGMPTFGSLKPKDLVGIPWMLAFALRADGWYLRSDIIWSKPNPMPESVTDRPTKAHEYLFLLTKSPRYYYDADAVREPHAEPWRGNGEHESSTPHAGRLDGGEQAAFTVATRQYNPAGRNLRTVWTIATQPYPGAHFATFPEALVEPCVKAGTSERGVCPECGAPWVRIAVPSGDYAGRSEAQPYRVSINPEQFASYIRSRREEMGLSRREIDDALGTNTAYSWWEGRAAGIQLPTPPLYARLKLLLALDDRYDEAFTVIPKTRDGWTNLAGDALVEGNRKGGAQTTKTTETTGWRPSCSHDLPPMPSVVLDPFAGSGTTGRVAQRLGRKAVLIDLSGEYLTQAMTRNQDIPLGLETA